MDVVQKRFGKDDFFTLTSSDDEGYQAPSSQQGKKCCEKHERCKRASDARRIDIIKGGKK